MPLKLENSKYTLTKGLTLWLTGLSGSGKSTIAKTLKEKLSAEDNPQNTIPVEILDGDKIREHINKDLGFTKEDRLKNIERVSYIASLLAKHGILVIVPVISPYEEGRKIARALNKNFFEVYIKADIETLKKRDVKGLYKKALSGEIKNFTGISDPYEEPENPDLIIETESTSVDGAVERIIEELRTEGFLTKG